MDNSTDDEALQGALYVVEHLQAKVFPVREGTKIPIISKWPEVASNDLDIIRGWAIQNPGCNWGMVCDDIAVVDVDRHPGGPDGHKALAELEEQRGKLETWRVHTPQGGDHYYFIQPAEKVRNKAKDGAGIEIKGDGGYVVLPGSSTPHGRYRWNDESLSHWPPELPAHVIAYVGAKANGKANGAAPGNSGNAEHRDPRKTALQQWFDTEVHKPHRHHALCHGVGLLAGAGTPWPATHAAVLWWCANMCVPPILDGDDLKTAMQSTRGVWEKEARRRIEADNDGAGDELVLDDLNDFITLELPKLEMVLDPIVPVQGLVTTYGYRGVGKTYFTKHAAYAIATGATFLRWKAPKPRRVLYIDGEVAPAEMQERSQRLYAAHPDSRPARGYFTLLSMMRQTGKALNLANDLDQAIAERVAADYEVLFLDNRSTLVYAGRENEAESWDTMQQWVLKLRSMGKTVWVCDHASRGGTNRGSSKREDVFNTVIYLKSPDDYEPQQGARFEVRFMKNRGFYGDDAEPFQARMETRDGADYWEMKSMAAAKEEDVLELFRQGKTSREIAEALGIGKSTVNRILTPHRVKK